MVEIFLDGQEYEPSLRLAYRIADVFKVPMEVVFSREPFPTIGEQFHGRERS